MTPLRGFPSFGTRSTHCGETSRRFDHDLENTVQLNITKKNATNEGTAEDGRMYWDS